MARRLSPRTTRCSHARADWRINQRLKTYRFFVCARWARAEPAAVFDAALVRPSRRTADAEVAAFAEVTFGGETCDRELPAAVFEALPVEPLVRTADDLLAARDPVTLLPMANSVSDAGHAYSSRNPASFQDAQESSLSFSWAPER